MSNNSNFSALFQLQNLPEETPLEYFFASSSSSIITGIAEQVSHFTFSIRTLLSDFEKSVINELIHSLFTNLGLF